MAEMEELDPRRSGLVTEALLTVVHDQMQIEVRRRLGIDALQETDELLMAMTWQTVPDDTTIEHAECREQCRSAVAFVIVCHRTATTTFYRKAGLGAIQCLDLRFLVYAQDERLVRRIQVQPHHIVELLDEMLVPAQLESLDEMRFQIVLFPDAADSRFAHSLRFCHSARTPVRRIRRSRVQCGLDNLLHFPGRNLGYSSRPRRIFDQAIESQSQKTFPPQLNSRARYPKCLGNLLALFPSGGHLNDSCSLNYPQGLSSTSSPFLDCRSLLRRKYNRRRYSAHNAT